MKQAHAAPRQQRSRLTESRLLNAALVLLDREGLEAATAPRIAAAAKLSAASIYRRFADKDDLLRAAFLKMLAASNQANADQLGTLLGRPTLHQTAAAITDLLVRQYRAHPRLLAALNTFIQSAPDSDFAREARNLIGRNLEMTAKVLLGHKDEIRHPRPALAAKFAVLSAASAIELAILEPGTVWSSALPLTDKALAGEVTRSMVAYLRAKP